MTETTEATIVDIPVQFLATYEDGEIKRLTVLPWESHAGYFGRKTSVYDGPMTDEELGLAGPDDGPIVFNTSDGPFWRAMTAALGKVPIEWEE